MKFKTNIGCTECLKIASILLDADPQILSWHVDIGHPDRLLVVKGLMLNSDLVAYNLRFAGFKTERIKES